jgi:ribonuclease Z
MSSRELVVLGSASQTPTRRRNQNGYLLRWDGDAVLFDPGEGTQRQLLLAGASPTSIRHICLTHFHGDHCLGLPGLLQRLSLDRVGHRVEVLYPSSGQQYFDRLRHATAYRDHLDVLPVPVSADGPVAAGPAFSIEAVRLDHEPETFGWRIVEPDGVRLDPARLAALGLDGPEVGRLRDAGFLDRDGGRIELDRVAVDRPGQRMAFVMDTGICDAAVELAAGADLLVCEATFSSADVALARRYRHLTAADAARIARDAGARRLVLTHFSQRYPDVRALLDEALAIVPDVVVAEDLLRVPVPRRGQASSPK